jgi:hypothetical protein
VTVPQSEHVTHLQHQRFSAELVDGISEAVALPLDPSARAAGITALVQEMHEALTWVDPSTAPSREQASFAQVLAETHRHRIRMSAPVGVPTPAGADITTSQTPATTHQLDEQVSSYDDLFVSTDPAGRVTLECPVCGFIPIPFRETTLSDFTNAAMDHLSEQHPYTLTLPSARTTATQTQQAPAPIPTRAPATLFEMVPVGSSPTISGP